MKKLILCCLMAVVALAVNAAEQQPRKGKKGEPLEQVVFVTDIDCQHCADKIMNNVPVLGRGVEDVTVDLPTKEVTVVYNPQKTSVETLVKGFSKIKVKAEPKPAEK